MSDIKTTPLPLLVKEGTKGRLHYFKKRSHNLGRTYTIAMHIEE
jgi:hypothetical protein